jgi:hypothetical protein
VTVNIVWCVNTTLLFKTNVSFCLC